jgi:hypothetical protein
MSFLGALIHNPALVLRHRNIFLLSHMRANTSLFGHLMGSHPQIEGYYEMHIGYYSWKSLWRQKLRHFANHPSKPQARYMFDKVLHDGHEVAVELLQRPSTRTIFMLREPEQSIRSLIALYRQHNPHLPEATAEGAVNYYVARLATLARCARQLGGRYFYLDAECLISRPDPTLASLSDWLELASPIPSRYSAQPNTGRGNAGDHSQRLKSGRIDAGRSDYSDVTISGDLIAQARQAYTAHRASLLTGAAAVVAQQNAETPPPAALRPA